MGITSRMLPKKPEKGKDTRLLTRVGRGCQGRGRGWVLLATQWELRSTGKRSSPWPEFPRAITDLK